MADTKISDLTALGEEPAASDLLVTVDVSDTTQASSGTTKKFTYDNIKNGVNSTNIFNNYLLNGSLRFAQRGDFFSSVYPNVNSNNDDVYTADRWILLSDGNNVVNVDIGDSLNERTVLLIHADGADGSTTFIDNSSYNNTITANGATQVDTAQSKFGGASALFDGTSDYLSASSSTSWAFGTEDFTVEVFARWAVVDGSADRLVAVKVSGGFLLYYNAGSLVLSNAVTNLIEYTWTPVADTWYHIALARSNGTTKMFIDGVEVASLVDSQNYAQGVLEIGGNSDTANESLNGWIDEIRIIKGRAAYTRNFTPPTIAFSNTAANSKVNLPRYIKSTVITTGKKFGFVQPIESTYLSNLSGGSAALSYIHEGSGITGMRSSILAWTGKRDVVTSDVVLAWGAMNVNPTLNTGWVYVSTPSTILVGTTPTTGYAVGTFSQTELHNAAVFVWSDTTGTSSGNYLTLSKFKLEKNTTGSVFLEMPLTTEELMVQRYFQLRSAAGLNSFDLRPNMRSTPTTSAFNKLITPATGYDAEM